MAVRCCIAWAAIAGALSTPAQASAPVAYQYVLSPAAIGDDAGEPSIAFNPNTGRGMYQSNIHALRYVLPEYRKDDALNPDGLPEACNATWEDVSPDQPTTLDPIGLGDPVPGRYFASQLALKASVMHYTDDDGATWTQSAGNFPGASGADHQSVGWAPYAPDPVVRPLTAYPHAIYYCAQDSDNVELTQPAGPAQNTSTAGYANCARSDDGGATFLPPVTIYTTVDCDGLHGHVRGAPDGTVYVPNKDCKPQQGVAVSTNNGVSWTVKRIPGTSAGKTDPQISLASDGTGYFCYTNGDGHAHAVVTHDRGDHWVNDVDLGAQVGVVTAVFTQGIAGDPDRAACGFIGTTTPGNSESEDFAGVWYPYVSITYDGGKTWQTTNVTPGDPAQGVGGICTAALACGNNRNLLDFNDMTLDDRGRPLYAFADGCPNCRADDPFVVRSQKAAIARLVGGKSLFASLDRAEPHAAQAPCLRATARAAGAASMEWTPPAFDGGSAVTGYRIYRATTPSAAGTLVATVGSQTRYTDTGADRAGADLYYTVVALNAQGAGAHSNRIRLALGNLPPAESACVAPGISLFGDGEGDAANQDPAFDVRGVSVSQPAFGQGGYPLNLHLQVSSLATVPPNGTWTLDFCAPDFPCANPGDSYSATNKYYTAEMSTTDAGTAAAPTFRIYRPTAAGTTALDRTVIPAGPGSHFDAGGLITFAVDGTDIGLAPAGAGTERLKNFVASASLAASSGGVTFSTTQDRAPDDGSGAGEFRTRALDACAVNTPPLAVLDATPRSGPSPLAVTLDGSASGDAEDMIAEYRFDFGDGSAPVTQASATVVHEYLADGTYDASLQVTDARGMASTAPSVRKIVVGVPPPAKNGNNHIGGGGAIPAGLLVAGFAAFARRRWRAR